MYSLTFSQSIETLLEKLKNNLYGKPTFLATQTVIVGSEEMKDRVLFALSDDPSIDCMSAVQVIVKDHVTEFLNRFCIDNSAPNRLEVSFYIEEFLHNAICKGNKDPLLSLIQEDLEKRLPVFSENLSELFMKYALFSPDFFGKNESFLSQLFLRLEKDLLYKTITPDCLLLDKVNKNMSLHIFCCRYFPPLYEKVFEKLSKACSVYSYVLSPSEHFWEDFLSDYEERRFLKKLSSYKEAHKELLAEKHPLLANFGVLKREYLKNLAQDFAEVNEDYNEQEPVFLLEYLRHDLLQLNKTKKTLKKDDSIQVFRVKSKLEEVLLVKQQIDQAGKEIAYKNIAIYSPDVDVYTPFIEMVFGQDIKIYGKSLKTVSHKLQGILDLLLLFESGIAITSFHSLLLNPSFQTKHCFLKDEIFRITRWFSSANIHRGIDLERFDRLIFGLVYYVDKDLFDKTYPMFGIEMGDADLLNKLVIVVTKLKEDVSYFQKKRPLEEYLHRLKDCELFYFSAQDNLLLSSVLESFNKDSLLRKEIDFVSLLYRVRSSLEKKKISSISNKIDLPTFTSLKNNPCCSFDMIFLLGMNESFFSYKKDPLDPMEYTSYTPSQKDQDHAFILEALLLARKKIIFTYSEKSEGENLALMVHELFSYIDTYYEMDGKAPSELLIASRYEIGFEKKELVAADKISIDIDQELAIDKTVKAQDLIYFAKHPIKFYFQKVMQIDLERSLLGKIDENFDFSMDGRNKALFKYLLLKQGYNKTLEEFNKQDLLPLPYIFEGISHEFLLEEKEIQELIKKFSLKRENFHSINLQKTPLNISIDESLIEITGSVDIHDEGFILPEDQLERIVRIWPAILIYASFHRRTEIALYFLKEKKKKVLFIENPEKELSLYLEYFFSAKKTPSPLMNFFIKPLLLKDEEAFVIKMQQIKGLQYEDPYLELFSSKYDLSNVYANWNEKLKRVFQTLITSYENADATI